MTVCRLVGHGARLDYIIAAGVALLLSDFCTLLEQEFDLLLKAIGVSPDLSQLLALEILQQFEGSNTVVISAVVLTLETNLHDTAVSGAAAEHEGPVQKFLEGLDAGRRQIYLQRHVFTTAEQVEHTHIFTGFSFAAIRCRTKAVHHAGSTGASGSADANLAIHRRTKRCGIVVIFAASWPVGAGGVVMQNDTYQSFFIVRIVRIIGRHLELECAAGGNLDTLKAHLQTISVLSQFLGAEIAFGHSGEREFFLFHQIAVLIIHSGSSLKIVMVADGQAAI